MRIRTSRIGAVLPVFALLLALSWHARAAVEAWVQRYRATDTSPATPVGVAMDAQGTVYVAGTLGETTEGSWPIAYMTLAYSRDGAPLWTNRYAPPHSAYIYTAASAIAVAMNGTVYVTGNANSGQGTSSDWYTLAYSKSGVPLWTNRYAASINGFSSPSALATDSKGNVFVTGGSCIYRSSNQTKYECVTLAYSNSGEPLWTNRYNNPIDTNTTGVALTMDSADQLYVAAASSENQVPYYAILAYTSSGVPLWTNRCCSNAVPYPDAALAVDNQCNVFVTASCSFASGGLDYVTIAYTSSGTALWTNRYNGPKGLSDYATAITTDSAGNVYVTGCADNPFPTTEAIYATVAYSGAGVPLWTNLYSAGLANWARAIATDSEGRIYVTGNSYVTGHNEADYATVAYSSNGSPLWTNRYDGPTHLDDSPQNTKSIAIGTAGEVIVTGRSARQYATVKYVQTPELLCSTPSFVTGGSLQLTLTAPTSILYRLEASTNLLNWLTLTTFPQLTSTSIQYTDTSAPSFPHRYYRAVWTP